MNPLMLLPVALLTAVLVGCGEESDRLPEDGRDFDGVEYGAPEPYTGKVIDGYLNNARVWLDLDGDSQFTPGPLDIELENGATVTLPSGEPTAMSGAGGAFALDIVELAVDPLVGPDLVPEDYPLFALAMPGKTVEEMPQGDEPVSRAYMLSAAAGVRNITPLTTLVRHRQQAGLGVLLEQVDRPGSALATMNLERDYLLAGDDQAHAYARAMVRFMASQFPEAYSEQLARPESDGTERLMSPEAAFLLGLSLVQNAEAIVAAVDAAAAGRYDQVDVKVLALPVVPLELSDPLLLTRQLVYAQPKQATSLPVSSHDLLISAELSFAYHENGRLKSVSANGCLAPSMPELARLIEVDGYMAELDSQWLPAAALSPQSRVHWEEPAIDERLTFDWDKREMTFDTRTGCHDHRGIFAGGSELGGGPEITFTWTTNGGEMEVLTATVPKAGGEPLVRTLQPETVHALERFPGYRIKEAGEVQADLVFTESVAQCTLTMDTKDLPLVVSANQPYTFTDYQAEPNQQLSLALEYDARDIEVSGQESRLPITRLLRYGFLDPAMAAFDHVDAEAGFEWQFSYPALGEAEFLPSQPNLISKAYLGSSSPVRSCNREFAPAMTSLYARVEYSYQHLSEYLVGLLE